MVSRLLKVLGLSTTEEVIGFLVCGMAVLPAMLFIAGERNAAAVVMLFLINALLVFGIRARENENLHEAEEAARQEAARAQREDDPPDRC